MQSDNHNRIPASDTAAMGDRADAGDTAIHRVFRSWLVLASIVVLAAVARFWALDFGLPHTQARPDETFTIDVALKLLRGELWPRFYDYPRLYAYAVTLLYLGYYVWGALTERFSTLAEMVASWPTYWAPFFLLSRGLSAAVGTLTVVVVNGIGRHLAGRGAGLIAAFFMSLAFIHVRDSHFGTTDVAMTLLAVCSVWWLLRDDGDGVSRYGVLAAVSAGLATATKYTAVLLTVPIGLSQLVRAVRTKRRPVMWTLAWSGVTLGGAFVLALLIGVPFVLFDSSRFFSAMSTLAEFIRAGNKSHIEMPNGWWFHFSQSLRYGVGAPLLGLGLAGGVLMAVRDWPRALVFWAFPVTCFAVAGFSDALFTRYMIPVVPFLCVGAAMAVVEIGRALGTRFGVRPAVVSTVVALATVAPTAWNVVRFDQVMGKVDNRVLVADWVQRQVPRGSSIVQSGSQYGQFQLQRGHGLRAWKWDLKRLVFIEDVGPAAGRPDWIVLQQSPLLSQNQGIVLDWLRSGYELVAEFVAFDTKATGNVYEPQDRFYLPMRGFAGVTRPGPNFYVYRRTDTQADGVSPPP